MSADLRDLAPELRPFAIAFVDFLRKAGLRVTVTSTVRSEAKQRKLYAAYLAGQSPYPAAPPGKSKHALGLAFDMVVEPVEFQDVVGAIWEQIGGKWGGSFVSTEPDPVHFEIG